MNQDLRRKLMMGVAAVAILAAAAFWLRDNSLWPFDKVAVDPALHNHPAFTYAQAGLNMDMSARTKPDPAGAFVSLAFKIADLATGQPKTDLEVSHGKPMHVVGMREGDLSQFFHIHPERKGDEWVAEYVIREPGTYSVWPGIAMGNGVVVERMPSFTVSEPLWMTADVDFGRTRSVTDNLRLVLDAPTQVTAGENHLWTFQAQDSSGREVILGSYLEATLHINIVSSDLARYQHLHTSYGMINPKDSGNLQLPVRIDQPGLYKVFVEFTALDSPGQVRLAEYWVEVILNQT